MMMICLGDVFSSLEHMVFEWSLMPVGESDSKQKSTVSAQNVLK